MSKDFASLPEARVILPKSPVEIGGPMWKRHTPSYYLAELIAALRGAGMLEGKLGAGPPPDWFPSDNWSWRTFKNSLSGPIKRKTDICESILHQLDHLHQKSPHEYHLEISNEGLFHAAVPLSE